MNYIKQFLSLLLALSMVLCLGIAVSADEPTYTITISNSSSAHAYEAYQIFTGTPHVIRNDDEVVSKTLSDIQWGANTSKTGAVSEDDLKDLTEEKLISYVDFSTPPVRTSTYSSGKHSISGLEAGYYLVKDKDESLNGLNESYTKYILEVVEDSPVTPKSSVPSVQKKVKDINDSAEDGWTDWQDSADHDLGDEIPFQLKATLANDVSQYLKYKVVFHDTMCKGLSFKEVNTFIVGDTRLTADDYTLIREYDENDNTLLTFTIEDVKALNATDSCNVTIEYTATLNEKADLGIPGNPNEVYLEYSNNPNWGWNVWTDTNKDGKWNEGEVEGENDNNKEDTGKTTIDKVIVFTYKTVINKVHQTGANENNQPVYEPLAGAAFKLEKQIHTTENDSWKEITCTIEDNGTQFVFSHLDDGFYRLTETKIPAGYNGIDPIYFTVTASHYVVSDNPALNSLSANQTDANGNDLVDGVIATFSATHNLSEGSLSSDVVNKSGVTLPSTGGMGTTLFYIVGSIMVLAAIVLLVTKKRMTSNE